MEWKWNNYHISTDKKRLSVDIIFQFLSQRSYWAKNRTQDQVVRSIEHSLCFGLFLEDKQVGFARVVTDYSTMFYLCDVFIQNEYRIGGLGKWLVESVVQHPDLKHLKGILLTQDAHGLYEKFGFKKPDEPDMLMIKEAE